jgi:glycosyltransferase involved in cell wall biosynthesis
MPVPSDQVALYLSAGDLGLLPRRPSLVNQVASPVKFAEYLAAGLPVLTNQGVGDYSELVHREGIGVALSATCTGLDATAGELVAFVESYVRAPLRMRDRCQAIARAHLDLESHIPAIGCLYRRLVAC